jgi:hypothetical protein
MSRKILIPVIVATGLVTVVTAAEMNAQNNQEDTLRSAISALAPEASVDSTDVRGRPYVMYSHNDELPTGYADIRLAGQQMKWLLQDYHPKTGQLTRLDVFVPVDVPGGRPTPLPAPDGSFTDRGTVNGVPAQFTATLAAGSLIVTSASDNGARQTVATLSMPAATDGAEVESAFVSKNGLEVNLVARNLRT